MVTTATENTKNIEQQLQNVNTNNMSHAYQNQKSVGRSVYEKPSDENAKWRNRIQV